MPIAARFWLVLAILVVAMGVLGFFGFTGLSNISDSATGLRGSLADTDLDHETRRGLVDLGLNLELQAAIEDPKLTSELRSEAEVGFVRLDLHLAGVMHSHARQAPDLAATVRQKAELRRIADRWHAGGFDIRSGLSGDRAEDARAAVIRRIRAMFAPLIAQADELVAAESRRAGRASERAASAYTTTRNLTIGVFSSILMLGVGMIYWLIRTVVPRTRRYSSFAAQVSAGNLGDRLVPRGSDELADLGHSLNDMVARHEAERDYQRGQAEFVDALQVSETEAEANQLIERHLERSVADSVVLVLNRNNSDDRLESRSVLEPGTPLAEGLDGATPRSCLAVRLGRRHEGGGDRDPLLTCDVCGKTEDMVTCSPLLVGGEVIGSVLVNHPEELHGLDDLRIRDSVTQAAPVLANLRNLAIAEMRASTDALTGLPNNRAVQDTIKRMVAHASRTHSPLAAALLDLDRFKQINDTYGHGRGDDVLAAVAEAMRAAARASDFVGRYGGEEFVILLPDTGIDGALRALETLRLAISSLSLNGIDHAITASIGVAILPDDATDADTLIRNADRALYAAKSKGRNRVERCGTAPEPGFVLKGGVSVST